MSGWAQRDAERQEAERFECEECIKERAILCKQVGALAEALRVMLDRYVSLVNCGDCGNWDPETEPSVQQARRALAEAGVAR